MSETKMAKTSPKLKHSHTPMRRTSLFSSFRYAVLRFLFVLLFLPFFRFGGLGNGN